MKFSEAIDRYVVDMFAQGRFTSKRTEVGYRAALHRHADDVQNRDPRYTNRNDVKRTLAHWRNPNSQRKNRAILVSFYDWCVEEGLRPANPARQTRRPRARPPSIYRLTRDEVVAMLNAAQGPRERRAIHLGFCAGLRNSELRGLQGRHFQRAGWVWVSADIAKGSKERWVPVTPELEPIVEEIRANVEADEFVLPAQRWRDPGINRSRADKRKHPSSQQALYYLVKRVGRRAGIAAPVHPHLMRHAFGDHVTRVAGIRNAQAVMGHASVTTTEGYLDKPLLEELAAAISALRFGPETERAFQGALRQAVKPLEATTGIEPVELSFRMGLPLRRLLVGSLRLMRGVAA